MRFPAPYADTTPDALEAWFESLRAKTPSERFAMVFEMNAAADLMAREGLRRLFPEADDEEIFLRFAAERLGRETMIAVYGWDPASNDQPIRRAPARA